MKLNTRNYQAGIDLGTTNSAISIVDSNGIQILEVEGGETLLPSCVFFHPDHGCLTGLPAKSQWANDYENGHKGFKRKMGTKSLFPIKSLNSNLIAEELSGIVLKKLQDVYYRNCNEELHTVIITIPARFDLTAVDATRIAAMGNYKMNGFSRVTPEKASEHYASFLQVETLMEPIAASMAYGMNKDVVDNSSWLVFDFGGGTFDAAVVNYLDGNMDVKYHAGHNQLGGHDLDIKMLHYVINKLNEKYDVKDFFTSSRYKTMYNKLLDEIEKIKITLSAEKDVVLVMPPDFRDNRNKEIKEEIKITREDYNSEVGSILKRSIDICQNMFREENIQPKDLDRVLLVGGPTQYPYFRELIKDQLKIDIDTTVNPMTAVASGAALFGASRDIPEEVKPEIIEILSQTPTDCRLEINCESSCPLNSTIVTGQVILPDDNYDMIDSITVTRADKGWESGTIKLQEGGMFDVEVHLREKQLNIFHIHVNGKGGKKYTVTDSEFSVIQGISTTDHAPFSLNVTVQGNKCVKLIPKDSEYPADGFETFYTTREIVADSGDDKGILYVEITEGESEIADNNLPVGTLKIPNEELTRSLPIDTELEITIEAKPDRTVTANCYIPFTGQSFDAVIKHDRTSDDREKTLEFFNAFKQEYQRIASKVDHFNDPEWNNRFKELELDKDVSEIEEIVVNEIEPELIDELILTDSIQKVKYLMSDAKLKLERFENDFIIDYTRFKLNNMKENLKEGDGEISDKIAEWSEQLDTFESEQSVDKVKAINDEMNKYDLNTMAITFFYFLEGFILTKQNLFVQSINDLKDQVIKADRYDLLPTMTGIIQDWNREINSSTKGLLLSKYYNRMGYELRDILDKNFENKETFPINDYDKITSVTHQFASVYDVAMLDSIANIRGASRSVLKKAIEFAQEYKKGQYDMIDKKLSEFIEQYFIEPSLRAQIGGGKTVGGPDIGSRN